MSNPNFDPQHSTHHIWRGDNMEQCLEDDLQAMEEDIARKAPASHEHTGYSASGHTHQPSEISGLIDDLAGKAAATHDHTLAQIVGLIAALAAKADLVDGVVPESQLPGYVDDVLEYDNLAAFPATGESGKVYLAKDTNKSYRWGGTTYAELNGGVALGETSATAYRGDHGKIAYDHSQAGNVHVTAAQKEAWNAKQAALTFDSTPTAGSTNPVTSGGVVAALSGKAPTSHTHEMSAIAGLLSVLMTDSTGNVLYNVTAGDMLDIIEEWDKGVYTAYFGISVTSIPKTTESWRCMVHKTGAAFAWVLAFGSAGSVFTNYLDNGTWIGWRTIYDVSPAPLWYGGRYMTADHTVTPSKKLSQCSHGWMLLWADYDPDTSTVNDKDFWTTFIPNRSPSGGVWSSKLFYSDIPRYIGDTLTDTSTEKRVIKQFYISDDKIVGHASNNKGDRTDVVLRAVYEF